MHWLWLCLKCECAQGLSNTNVGIQQSYWEHFPEGTVTQLCVSAWPLGCACSTHLQLCHQQAPAKSTQLLKESSFLWSWVNFAGNSKHILLSKFILLPINRGRQQTFQFWQQDLGGLCDFLPTTAAEIIGTASEEIPVLPSKQTYRSREARLEMVLM